MYTNLVVGEKSHKGSPNALLNFYYTFPYALLVFCVGDQMFLIAIYLLYFVTGYQAEIVLNIAYFSFPVFFGKQFMNVVQLYVAIDDLNEHEMPTRAKKSTTTAAGKKQ
jgi:ABC-type polysaccharide/polyol phosphate export permease